MVLKRKRSDDEDAMSICSSSSRSSSTSPFSNNAMMLDMEAITQHHIPMGVHSRTLKRWRNSRPDEKTVHDYTISKLFSAQRSTQQQAAPQSFSAPSFTPKHPLMTKRANVTLAEAATRKFAAAARLVGRNGEWKDGAWNALFVEDLQFSNK
ncbi:hypothetical protein H072_3833 [Dactylellina haptotyla CBS 200.50]|uniref:Uncharacterized protein n=1 Tax=Dactylellina haptotyla (strain CBS 200.50) TaxID=1284197 RepID=S8AG95_DACHA|nr:hypothetical protein H072_3833 [Dactylellina haptotyla CBS 200.50]